MSKDNYIMRSLSKLRHKPFEHFVINRIYHRLSDPEIKFICQQYVSRPNGYAMTDMFFPQFRLHLEVDEPYHAHTADWDGLRMQDIVNATDHAVVRIAAVENGENRALDKICDEVDNFVEELKKRKRDAGTEFEPWDYENEFSPIPHIERGYIDTKEGVVFRYHRDALRCFGYTGGHFQKGMRYLDRNQERMVWFPRLWKHGKWTNSLSPDGNVIREDADDQDVADYRKRGTPDLARERIVFAMWRDPLGRRVYRFAGVFQKDKEASDGQVAVFEKISDRFNLNTLTTEFEA